MHFKMLMNVRIKTKEKEADLNKMQLDTGDDADTIKKFEAKWFN